MATLTSSGAVMFAAGKHAPEGISTESMSGALMWAESHVCMMTKKNWVDIYDTLNPDVKFAVNDAATKCAAMDIISYDMSGYTSRAEAQTMLDVLQDRASKSITQLKDFKTKDFMDGA